MHPTEHSSINFEKLVGELLHKVEGHAVKTGLNIRQDNGQILEVDVIFGPRII